LGLCGRGWSGCFGLAFVRGGGLKGGEALLLLTRDLLVDLPRKSSDGSDALLGIFVGGDGCDLAVDWVVDDLFDEVLGLFVPGVAACSAADAGAPGFAVVRLGFGVGEIEGGDLEAVEEESGAAGVDLVGGDAAEDLADGDLDGTTILGEGQVEGGLVALADLGFPFWDWAAIFVVVVAEVFVAERWAATAVARGEDVAALEAWFGDGFGRHVGGAPCPGFFG
jgi:hypothetical protein